MADSPSGVYRDPLNAAWNNYLDICINIFLAVRLNLLNSSNNTIYFYFKIMFLTGNVADPFLVPIVFLKCVLYIVQTEFVTKKCEDLIVAPVAVCGVQRRSHLLCTRGRCYDSWSQRDHLQSLFFI
jgi:hypothetical protein